MLYRLARFWFVGDWNNCCKLEESWWWLLWWTVVMCCCCGIAGEDDILLFKAAVAVAVAGCCCRSSSNCCNADSNVSCCWGSCPYIAYLEILLVLLIMSNFNDITPLTICGWHKLFPHIDEDDDGATVWRNWNRNDTIWLGGWAPIICCM